MHRVTIVLAALAASLLAVSVAFASGGSRPVVSGSLSAVTASPATIVGGSNATGKATFTAPATDGAVLNITSSNPAVAQVPAQSVVSKGTSSGTFTIATAPVEAPTQVTITVLSIGVTRTTTITVVPGTPPAADTVAIKKAEFKAQGNAGFIDVEATSSNADAILGVYAGNVLLFTLTNNGGGRYFGSKAFLQSPGTITVRSNFGGSASATI